MLSSIFPVANMGSSVGTAGNKAAKLAALNQQLSACEEELKTVAKQCASVPTKESDQKVLSSRITAIKAQISDLSQADGAPSTARAVEPSDEAERSRAQSAEKMIRRDSLAVGPLDLAREGYLGTRINLLA